MTNKDDITASPSLRNEEYCTCTRENTEREHDDDDHTKDTKVGRKRQIIGILVRALPSSTMMCASEELHRSCNWVL